MTSELALLKNDVFQLRDALNLGPEAFRTACHTIAGTESIHYASSEGLRGIKSYFEALLKHKQALEALEASKPVIGHYAIKLDAITKVIYFNGLESMRVKSSLYDVLQSVRLLYGDGAKLTSVDEMPLDGDLTMKLHFEVAKVEI